MGTFRTQFERNNILTLVTAEQLEENTFGCTLHADPFDKGQPAVQQAYDIVIQRVEHGLWKAVGTPNIELDEDDLLSLGNAIEGDKTVDLFGSELY